MEFKFDAMRNEGVQTLAGTPTAPHDTAVELLPASQTQPVTATEMMEAVEHKGSRSDLNLRAVFVLSGMGYEGPADSLKSFPRERG